MEHFKHGGVISSGLRTDISIDKLASKLGPHVRIEFDDIHDIKVFIDGEEKIVSRLYVNWLTDTSKAANKKFSIETINKENGRVDAEGQEY